MPPLAAAGLAAAAVVDAATPVLLLLAVLAAFLLPVLLAGLRLRLVVELLVPGGPRLDTPMLRQSNRLLTALVEEIVCQLQDLLFGGRVNGVVGIQLRHQVLNAGTDEGSHVGGRAAAAAGRGGGRQR